MRTRDVPRIHLVEVGADTAKVRSPERLPRASPGKSPSAPFRDDCIAKISAKANFPPRRCYLNVPLQAAQPVLRIIEGAAHKVFELVASLSGFLNDGLGATAPFPHPEPSARYRFAQETFAATRRDERDAP